MHTDNHSYYSVFNSVVRTVVRSTSQSYGDSKISGVRTPKLLNRLTKKFGVGDYVGDDSLHAKTQNERPIWDVAAYA